MDEATRRDQSARERLVDVGDRRLAVRLEGTGHPAVILDAGLADTTLSAEWAAVQNEVAAFTLCCAYARAGLGRSEPAPGPHTSMEAAEDLWLLLQAAPIDGPYVLVGHSLGGLHAQLFVAQHPGAVAGMVLVDATVPDHFAWLERNQLPPDLLAQERRAAAGDNPEGIALDTALRMLQHRPWHLEGPLVVLVRDHVPPEEQPPEWSSEREEKLLATWREVQTELATHSPQGEVVVAERSGHNIQHYRPDAIVAAIQKVVVSVRQEGQPQSST